MEIRKTTQEDLEEVLRIYDEARRFMRASGNAIQWTGGYPGEDLILDDIRKGWSYICCAGDEIAAVFTLATGEDPTYKTIHNGEWLNDRPYGTVHRIAVAVHNNGVARFCLNWCVEKCRNIRVDTHEVNRPMRSLLEKCGFQYCGVIYLPDGSPRFAYQKTVE
jgi:RimJ/RimL family protein N-acetyltransferase